MKRRRHYVYGNKNTELVHDAIWVDTEGNRIKSAVDEERHTLMQGMACYRRRIDSHKFTDEHWHRFTTIDEFWDWVEDRLHGKTRIYIFAHNWSYDGPILDIFNTLPDRGWKLISAVINSPPIILRWRKQPYTIQIVDTLNIWRMKLEKIGDALALPKLAMPDADAPASEWDTYNKRDVEIIMQACMQWWQYLYDNDLGGFACTLASQAMRTYRHRFMHHKILIDDDETSLKLARMASHGGRCECHYIGEINQRVYRYDINSQYPAIMATEKMPARLIGHYRKVSDAEINDWAQNYCVIAHVGIETDQPVYGVVHNKRLVFPVGTFPTVLTTPEVQYALAHNHIKQIYSVAVYEPEVLFSEFINFFYSERLGYKQRGDDMNSLNTKLFMNSLSGKWGQKGMFYEKVDTTPDLSIRFYLSGKAGSKDVWHMRQFAGVIEKLSKQAESKESHPAIYAHITAHGRIQLWGLMQVCGAGHYYYNDTDSLWVDKIGAANLAAVVHPTKLGRLALEGTHNRVIIHGSKDYWYDGMRRIKGIRSDAEQIGPNTYRQVRFSSLLGLMREGDLSAPIVRTITKQLRREYLKGKVAKSGVVTPLTLTLKL